MTLNFSISLKNRLALVYALFTSLALGLLILLVNQFSGIIFTALIKENIAEKSREIVANIGDQYNSARGRFNIAGIEPIGMYFAQAGYIISVEDENGRRVWDARSHDMQCCVTAINNITSRMTGRFNIPGETRRDRYSLNYGNRTVGNVIIETYGPFFYSETEARFLSSLNRLLFVTGIVLIAGSIIISFFLSRTIARPIMVAQDAAQKIAQIHCMQKNSGAGRAIIRIPGQYKTRELAELSRSINTLAEELEKRELRQKQFTGDIAHELRTPLACLQGNIEAMMDGVYPTDNEHLQNCHEEVIRLANLVQDLSTIDTLEWETITLNKTEFDLAKLLQITAEQWKQTAHEKGITIELHTEETIVNADYDRLKQVFINLLSNAVKYTDKGSISITIEKKSETPDQGCLISIADTGIGIPADELPHIFERFYRSDKSRSRSTGGAGIGLAIAAAIIRAHGGTIEAQSGGTGTVFTVAMEN